MSRYYSNKTMIQSKKEKFNYEDFLVAEDIYDSLWNIEDKSLEDDGTYMDFSGESSLCGGEREDEAHNRFVKAFREVFPDCGVETIWTYLEDLPTNTYTTEPGEKVT